jgi:hypothetical protein
VLQKPQEQANRLAPPRTLILDFTMTHTRFQVVDQFCPNRQRSHTINRPDPITFIPVAVDTSGRIYDDFSRLLFFHTHREASDLANELRGKIRFLRATCVVSEFKLPEESDQIRFLRAACVVNLKGSVGLILTKPSVMRISIPVDLSSRSFKTLLTTVFHSF